MDLIPSVEREGYEKFEACVDSGATANFSHRLDLMHEYFEYESEVEVLLASEDILRVVKRVSLVISRFCMCPPSCEA